MEKHQNKKKKLLEVWQRQEFFYPKERALRKRIFKKKIRDEVGLPPEPKTDEERKRYKKATEAGIILPLEGKSHKQKENILRAQRKAGVRLPKARTSSENALIAKIKAEHRKPLSSKLSKAAAFFTPLKGKTPEQKEKALKKLAMSGHPLPEGKTSSEKKLTDKVRADLGLPPEPKTKDEQRIYDKAAGAGIITPLEGKTADQKKKILKAQQAMGIRLPTGRTKSEKDLVASVQQSPKFQFGSIVSIPTEKLKQAMAAGILSPFDKKSSEDKEKALKALAMNGIPLLVGKASDQKIMNKVRNDLGLPPEPKTTADKKKYDRALTAGIITPLEGKTPVQKRKILKAQQALGMPLPVGRTSSEKKFITEIQAFPKIPFPSDVSIQADKLKVAMAAGVLSQLANKTPAEQENMLKTRAMNGIPLPKGNTASIKKLLVKVRNEVGLPPEPETEADRKKYNKALAAGIISPLEGKTLAQKKKTLKAQHALGMPLPVGRTPSEKALVNEVKATPTMPLPSKVSIPPDKLRKAMAAGVFSPFAKKSTDEKEKALKFMAMNGIPLPVGDTLSEKQLVDKVRKNVALPPAPKSAGDKDRYNTGMRKGFVTPLEGKTSAQKEKVLRAQHQAHIPLPEGRTPSEKSLIAKVKAGSLPPSVTSFKRDKKLKPEVLFTPLDGKSPEQKENILKDMARQGIALPEGKSRSDKRLIDKVRADLGLPPEPTTDADRKRQAKAAAAGIISPLEGKTTAQKKKTLKAQQAMGIPLPIGRTLSEKALISEIQAAPNIPFWSDVSIPADTLKDAMDAGALSPFAKKSPADKEKAIKNLAMNGIPLPKPESPADKKLIDKVRNNIGLPPEPKTPTDQKKYDKAFAAGVITPLEGKTPAQKKKTLKAQNALGIPLPIGRTPSEKALIAEVQATPKIPYRSDVSIPADKLKEAMAAGLLSPFTKKTPADKEKALKIMAMNGIPFPKAESPPVQKLINKVRDDVGLPPEPKTEADRKKYDKALVAGIISPLEGKTPAQKKKTLKAQHALGIPLPFGRTPSEKALLNEVKATPTMPLPSKVSIPPDKLRKAMAAGVFSPFAKKSTDEKEKALKFMAMNGIPLPVGDTLSEKQLVDKVRKDVALPPAPKSAKDREHYNKGMRKGFVTPLEGKTSAQKEKVLRAQHQAHIPLPEGRTPSEKSLIAKVKAGSRPPSVTSSKRDKKLKPEVLFTPLDGKSPEQKENILKDMARQGIALPEGKSRSDKRLIDKVRADLGLPPEPTTDADRKRQAKAAGIISPLEGKTPAQKKKTLKAQQAMGIPLPIGRTLSEKALISEIQAAPNIPFWSDVSIPADTLKDAMDAGALSPFAKKSPADKEKAIKNLAMNGIPLPKPESPADKKLIDKVRNNIVLPPEPKTPTDQKKYDKAFAAGVITPLEGKTPAQKKKTLKAQNALGIPLPIGRTPSEKALIAEVQATPKIPYRSDVLIPADKLKEAMAAGALSPFTTKTPADKEKALKIMAMNGIPFPKSESPSVQKLINKVRDDVGLPPEPKTEADRKKYDKALVAGIISPLEGKTPAQKKKTLKAQHTLGMPLPVGRTPSEKALINEVKATPKMPLPSKVSIPPDKLRKAMAAGVFSPFAKKSPAEKEKALKFMAMNGIPLPDGDTLSEKQLVDKVRKDVALPPAPKSAKDREHYNKGMRKGFVTPLEGKTSAQKEKVLRAQHQAHIALPEGRTPSEKSLIAKVKAEPRPPSVTSSKRGRKLKPEVFFTPLDGKSPEQKENILKDMARQGIALPEGKSRSDKRLIDKVRADLGLPPEPTTDADRKRQAKAAAAGIISPLEGKTPAQKKKTLKAQQAMGIPLPIGRTPSEKALISEIQDAPNIPFRSDVSIPADTLKDAMDAGALSPFAKKSRADKEKAIKNLAMNGIPLPKPESPADKKLIDKVRNNIGLPPEPKTPTDQKKYDKAFAAGVITPLEGKTPAQKKKTLKAQHALGIPLPLGRTPSEKALIAEVQATPKIPYRSDMSIPADKLKEAMAAGALSPFTTKTPAEKEKALRYMALNGILMPEGETSSDIKLIDKVRKDVGLPPTPKSIVEKDKYKKGIREGIVTPLEGKTRAEKEKILKGLQQAHIPLPEGRTPSENAVIAKIKEESRMPSAVLLDKERKSKVAALLTALKGKTPEEKSNVLKNIAKRRLPLPVGKTKSEKDLIHKLRKDLGLPPEPKTREENKLYDKAFAAGIISPLDGKSAIQKKKLLKAQQALGIPLPEGRTPSEKRVIDEMNAIPKMRFLSDVSIPTHKLKQAMETGGLSPFAKKSLPEKEKALKHMAINGIPLPKSETLSDQKLIDKVRVDIGLPPEPKTKHEKNIYNKALAAGIVTPLQGKNPDQIKNALNAQHALGLKLPVGRTPSERDLIAKIEASPKIPFPFDVSIPTEKLKTAMNAGVFSPLAKKSPADEEKALRLMAMNGIPLPEGETPLETELINKVRKEVALPPAPMSPSERDKYYRGMRKGVVTPLEGKSHEQKEKILRGQHHARIPLPEGRTSSEKALIAKIKGKSPSISLISPLEGKTPEEKEKLLEKLAKAGLPMPEAKTVSEKSMIRKVKTKFGIPPEAKTASEKEIVRKAKANGLFTPLNGKTPEQQKQIIKGLAEAGLPLPVGSTKSEKEMVKKVRAELGLPLLSTPSERKGKIKVKTKVTGVGDAGITEYVKRIEKITKCDRACGCDKKKIKFKHSYIKIRVTSPDISSFCSCSDECLPEVRRGVFTDNEGIKVTVGSAVGIPSYYRQKDVDSFRINSKKNYYSSNKQILKHLIDDKYTSLNKRDRNISEDKSLTYIFLRDDQINDCFKSGEYNKEDDQSNGNSSCSQSRQSCISLASFTTIVSSSSSYEYVVFIKSSYDFGKNINISSSISMSMVSIECTSTGTFESILDNYTSIFESLNKPINEKQTTESMRYKGQQYLDKECKKYASKELRKTNRKIDANHAFGKRNFREPIVLMDYETSNRVKADFNKLLLKKSFSDSTVFIVVPASDSSESENSESRELIGIQISSSTSESGTKEFDNEAKCKSTQTINEKSDENKETSESIFTEKRRRIHNRNTSRYTETNRNDCNKSVNRRHCSSVGEVDMETRFASAIIKDLRSTREYENNLSNSGEWNMDKEELQGNRRSGDGLEDSPCRCPVPQENLECSSLHSSTSESVTLMIIEDTQENDIMENELSVDSTILLQVSQEIYQYEKCEEDSIQTKETNKNCTDTCQHKERYKKETDSTCDKDAHNACSDCTCDPPCGCSPEQEKTRMSGECLNELFQYAQDPLLHKSRNHDESQNRTCPKKVERMATLAPYTEVRSTGVNTVYPVSSPCCCKPGHSMEKGYISEEQRRILELQKTDCKNSSPINSREIPIKLAVYMPSSYQPPPNTPAITQTPNLPQSGSLSCCCKVNMEKAIQACGQYRENQFRPPDTIKEKGIKLSKNFPEGCGKDLCNPKKAVTEKPIKKRTEQKTPKHEEEKCGYTNNINDYSRNLCFLPKNYEQPIQNTPTFPPPEAPCTCTKDLVEADRNMTSAKLLLQKPQLMGRSPVTIKVPQRGGQLPIPCPAQQKPFRLATSDSDVPYNLDDNGGCFISKQKPRKTKKEKPCACEMYSQTSQHDLSEYEDDDYKESKKSKKEKRKEEKEEKKRKKNKEKAEKSKDSKKKKSKSNRCDCNTETEPDFDFELLAEMIKENRQKEREEGLKIISKTTQTTSGFKVKVAKRPPSISSFEDAIQYVQDHPEEFYEKNEDVECQCNQKKKKKGNCQCPEEKEPEVVPEEPFKGFKIAIEGKGSGSKGLSGVCCFDMLQEQPMMLQTQTGID